MYLKILNEEPEYNLQNFEKEYEKAKKEWEKHEPEAKELVEEKGYDWEKITDKVLIGLLIAGGLATAANAYINYNNYENMLSGKTNPPYQSDASISSISSNVSRNIPAPTQSSVSGFYPPPYLMLGGRK